MKHQMNRVRYFVYGCLALFAAFYFASNPVPAQGMSPYGMWEDYRPSRPMPEWWTQTVPAPAARYNVNPGPRPQIIPEEPEIGNVPNHEEPGTVVILTKHKLLYYVIDEETVLVYPIAVGRKGFQWSGTETVSRIEYWPAWNPPPEMRARQPGLPERMEGGINNPLGAVAMYLGNTLYRIHGSNDPKSIGTESSSGCIRMHNAHAVHLASLVHPGTIVKVY